MRKIILSVIVSILMTFVFAELFSLYSFGTFPTLLTFLYLIFIFSIIEYIILFVFFIIERKRVGKKLSIGEVSGRILLFIALLLILTYFIVLKIDYLNWYMYSSPFYVAVIERSVEFVLPAIVSFLLGLRLLKKNS